jgi:hypothetical protein
MKSFVKYTCVNFKTFPALSEKLNEEKKTTMFAEIQPNKILRRSQFFH